MQNLIRQGSTPMVGTPRALCAGCPGRTPVLYELVALLALVIFALGVPAISTADEIGLAAPDSTGAPTMVEASIDQLSWLAGSWRGSRDDITYEEVWMAPSGTMMPGVHRDVRTDGRTAFEFLRIAEAEGGLIYYASPSGRAPTDFPLVEISANRAVFENPQHDFPQRLIYRRDGDVLHVRIDSRTDIGEIIHAIEWQWQLVAEAAKPVPSEG